MMPPDLFIHDHFTELRREIDLVALNLFGASTSLNADHENQWIEMIKAVKTHEKECHLNLNHLADYQPKSLLMNQTVIYLSEKDSIGKLIFIRNQYFTDDCIQLIKNW